MKVVAIKADVAVVENFVIDNSFPDYNYKGKADHFGQGRNTRLWRFRSFPPKSFVNKSGGKHGFFWENGFDHRGKPWDWRSIGSAICRGGCESGLGGAGKFD
jgi:hypothetical protein